MTRTSTGRVAVSSFDDHVDTADPCELCASHRSRGRVRASIVVVASSSVVDAFETCQGKSASNRNLPIKRPWGRICLRLVCVTTSGAAQFVPSVRAVRQIGSGRPSSGVAVSAACYAGLPVSRSIVSTSSDALRWGGAVAAEATSATEPASAAHGFRRRRLRRAAGRHGVVTKMRSLQMISLEWRRPRILDLSRHLSGLTPLGGRRAV